MTDLLAEDAYITISKPTQGIFKDRGSKFIAYAFPINNTSDVKQKIDSIRSEHPSARHVCYAYLIGNDGNDYRANDDGEPSGSAGLPILNQIKSKEVTNTLVAVVRYFGGTKLGVSGLINAYKTAAKEALQQASAIEKVPTEIIEIQFPHSSTGDVERTIRMENLSVKDQQFGMDCIWTLECERLRTEEVKQMLAAIPQVHLR